MYWGLYHVTPLFACNVICPSHAMAPRCDGNQGMLLRLPLHIYGGYIVTAQRKTLYIAVQLL